MRPTWRMPKEHELSVQERNRITRKIHKVGDRKVQIINFGKNFIEFDPFVVYSGNSSTKKSFTESLLRNLK